jgi:hypothetical protein
LHKWINDFINKINERYPLIFGDFIQKWANEYLKGPLRILSAFGFSTVGNIVNVLLGAVHLAMFEVDQLSFR